MTVLGVQSRHYFDTVSTRTSTLRCDECCHALLCIFSRRERFRVGAVDVWLYVLTRYPRGRKAVVRRQFPLDRVLHRATCLVDHTIHDSSHCVLGPSLCGQLIVRRDGDHHVKELEARVVLALAHGGMLVEIRAVHIFLDDAQLASDHVLGVKK